ncbi:MAG: sugar phosphate nucleotidyltransferase, partial [Hyphomicrobiales bacterium]
MTRTVAVIPAGGAGTRLWPRSRRSTPKHALPLGGGGRPLLRDTYDRVCGLADEVF